MAEVLNFRLASERLHVTVSAISHRIQVLEQELGLQLFDRGHRRLRLTDDGTAFLERLRPGIRLLQDATMVSHGRMTNPVLRVAAPPLLNGWFLQHLGEFQAQHPGVRIELLSSGRRRSASVDISIVPLTALHQREGAEALLNINISVVCSPALLAANPVTEPRDLLTMPLIDTIPSLKGWNEWFRAAGVDEEVPPPALALDNQALVYPAVLEGRGFAIGMRSLTAGYLAQGLMVEPFSIACNFSPALGVRLNEGGNIKLARAFAAWLTERLVPSAEKIATTVQQN